MAATSFRRLLQWKLFPVCGTLDPKLTDSTRLLPSRERFAPGSLPPDRAGARGARAGRAAEAVRAGRDGAPLELLGVELAEGLRAPFVRAEPEHLVEVAVVETARPVHAQSRAAHQPLDRGRVEGVHEAAHVALLVPRAAQVFE